MKKPIDKAKRKRYLGGVKLTGRKYDTVWDLMKGEKVSPKVRKKFAEMSEKV